MHQEESGAVTQWVPDKKVSEAGGGSFACSEFLSTWCPPQAVSAEVPHRQLCSCPRQGLHPPHSGEVLRIWGLLALVFLRPP